MAKTTRVEEFSKHGVYCLEGIVIGNTGGRADISSTRLVLKIKGSLMKSSNSIKIVSAGTHTTSLPTHNAPAADKPLRVP